MPYKSKLTRQRLAQLFLDIKSRRFSDIELGKMYKIDRTSCLYYRRKLGVQVTNEDRKRFLQKRKLPLIYTKKEEKFNPISKNNYEFIILKKDGRINEGKNNYKEYKKENDKRFSIYSKIGERAGRIEIAA